MKEFIRLRAKTYSYVIDNGSKDKKAKDAKKSISCKESLNLKIN